MSENSIKGILDVTMDKVRAMADADTIIGKPIELPNSITIIPISKVAFGFASGGSDVPNKSASTVFAGGSGAGVTVSPLGFIVIKENEVRLLQLSDKPGAVDKAVSMVPDVLDKLADIFGKSK